MYEVRVKKLTIEDKEKIILMNSEKKLLLLGQSGLFAQAVLRQAGLSSYKVIVLSRAQGTDLSKISSFNSLKDIFNQIKPDLLINAVGVTDLRLCEQNPEYAWNLNARLPSMIAKWANQTLCPWVHISTDHFFNDEGNILHDENSLVKPLNEYASSKFAGESLALTSSTALVIRTNIIGKRGWTGKQNFAEWAISCLQKQTLIEAYIDTWASSIEVGQFTKLLMKLVESDEKGLINLASSESISKADLIEKIAYRMKLSTKYINRIKTPMPSNDQIKRSRSMGLDCSKAQKTLKKLGLKLPNTDQVVDALIKNF